MTDFLIHVPLTACSLCWLFNFAKYLKIIWKTCKSKNEFVIFFLNVFSITCVLVHNFRLSIRQVNGNMATVIDTYHTVNYGDGHSCVVLLLACKC